MKKTFLLLLTTFIILTMSGCQPQKNTLWEKASPQNSALAFFCYDGESTTLQYLFSSGSITKLLDELSSVRATAADKWSPELITLPVYGIQIMDTDGNPLEAAWSNGYLITQDGNAYRFDFDFSVITDTYEFDSPDTWASTAVLPCADHLSKYNGQWYTTLMNESDTLTPPEGISLEITDVSDQKIKATLTNQTGNEWCYGEFFSLQTELDGKWYIVPTTSGTNWAFNAIGYILTAGQETSKTYSLDMYGDLPDGNYRIIVENLSAEFSVSEGILILN